MSQYSFIYSTFPDSDSGKKAAFALLEKRLVACANILPQVQSYYWWEEKIDSAEEVILVAKTQASRFEQVKSLIQSLHPYSCPCIIALPIEAGHAPFLEWIKQETNV